MDRVYHRYWLWEDYINGMYDTAKRKEEKELIAKAEEILKDNTLFYNTCKQILMNWPIATVVNLTDKTSSRKAWLGQAACNFAYGVPEFLTRVAWGRLTREEQASADSIAFKIIRHFELNYEEENKGLRFDLGKTVL
jgi:hypothetical protein